jgi:hypothetical protein
VPTAEACATLIAELMERDYLREPTPTAEPEARKAGRPHSPTYAVNPATHATP